MKGRRIPSDAERELWRTVMRDAVPLHSRRAPAIPPAPAEAPPPPPAVPASTAAPAPAGGKPPPRSATALPDLPVAARARVRVELAPSPLGPRAGVDRRTDEKVRKGRMPVDGRIDLHGMTQSLAHDALLGWLRRCHAEGRRLVLVITGKGSLTDGAGVLRSAVPRWLHEAPFRTLVLAVHQAQPQHGGAGAFYVYLKRRRER